MVRDQRIENRIIAAMGSYPTALEALKRADFASDAEFVEACIDYDMQHNDPARAALRRQYTRAVNEMREKEADAAEAARLEEIRQNTRLTDEETAEIERTATIATVDALRAGKVAAEDFTRAKEKAVDKLTKEAIGRKSGSQFLNERFRADYRATRGISDDAAQQMSKETMEALTGGNSGGNAY